MGAPKLSAEQVAVIVERRRNGEAPMVIARDYGVGSSALSFHFRKAGIPKPTMQMGEAVCLHCEKPFTYPLSMVTPGRARMFCGETCRVAGYRGDLHGNTKTEGSVQSNGYRFVRVPLGHVSSTSVRRRNTRRTAEHVMIAESALGRPLVAGEVVHHINCDKTDNRNSNLLVCSRAYHAWLHGEMSRRYAREHFGVAP